MTDYENREATPATEADMGEELGATQDACAEESECEEILAQESDREEYERLIKERFREHYARDTQRLINRRFKKYKALEEKVKALEEEVSRHADVETLLKEERERAVRETEERMSREFRAMRMRAQENALSPHTSRSPFDVARLTKSERALLATRAQKGEKIHL
ncbi:MAG: hypothetical protein IKJ24_05290 [Clostridia bacterium]|nr:hypothetical protein [Clostridia bacterium]